MNEQEWADHFSRDVDGLLNEAGRADGEPTPTEYRQALNLARTLAATDLSGESQVRATLRRRLLSQFDAREGRKDTTMKSHPYYGLRRRLLIAIGSALALLLIFASLYPGGPTVFAQGVGIGAKMIVLGAYSKVQQTEAWVTGKPAPDDGWDVTLFRGYGEGGNGPPGTNPTVRSVTDLKEAQKIATFHIRTPGYLPEGYSLREIKLAPIWTGPGALLFPNAPNIYLFYGGPSSDIVVVQKPVGPQPGGPPGTAVGQFVGFVTNGTLEEVDLDGRKAAWADGRLLMWEADGISYLVGGAKLSLDEAIRIAESLK